MSNNLSKVDKEKCATLVIDMQNDFIAEGAPIECPGGRDIIPNIKQFVDWSRKNDIPVIYTQERHRSQKVDFGLELERDEPEHCLEGTEGIEIVEELQPKDEDYVIPKTRYSAFYSTDLELLLKGLERTQLIITGAATNVCVYGTTLGAMYRDYKSVVLEDCVAGTEESLHEAFLKNIDYVLGDVVESGELISLLSDQD